MPITDGLPFAASPLHRAATCLENPPALREPGLPAVGRAGDGVGRSPDFGRAHGASRVPGTGPGRLFWVAARGPRGGALPGAIAGDDDDFDGGYLDRVDPDPAHSTGGRSAVAAALRPDFEAPAGGDMAVDLDGDGVADLSLVGLGGASRPGLTWREEEEHRRDALRNGRALAVMTMFRIGLTHQEYVAAIGTVARFELALIGHFREAVPDPSERWDAKRRFREIERRLARLRWVEMEQEKEFGGFRGLFNKARGRRRVTGKEMYEKMIADADDLVMAMAERRPADEISYVMQFGGMPEGRRALP